MYVNRQASQVIRVWPRLSSQYAAKSCMTRNSRGRQRYHRETTSRNGQASHCSCRVSWEPVEWLVECMKNNFKFCAIWPLMLSTVQGPCDKSSQSCSRRILYMLKSSSTDENVSLFVSEALLDQVILITISLCHLNSFIEFHTNLTFCADDIDITPSLKDLRLVSGLYLGLSIVTVHCYTLLIPSS